MVQCQLIKAAITASRTLTVNLSPPVLVTEGILRALDWLVKWMQERYNLTVNLALDGERPNVEKEVEIIAFDSVRELLFNIVKHAEVSEAELIVKCSESRFNIVVSDTGVGFDTERTLSRPQFGLQNTLRRIELIGGSVRISSEPGKGSSISLHFPTSEFAHGRQIRIVIVDDHAIVREGVRTMIECEPDLSIVGEAANLEESLHVVQHALPDVVLMDISLGSSKANGVEVTKQLRLAGYEGEIIILSSYEAPQHQRALSELNVYNYLIKGDSVHKMLSTIRNSCAPSSSTITLVELAQ